ncbi:MAG: type II secretion system protein GspK [Lentisphaeria bacterium]|nr:type II secretion system protein GspK [Lentisphaeria bacterium]
MSARGSLLITVLWWVVILSIMAVGLYAMTRPRVELAGRMGESAALRAGADAALYSAIALVGKDPSPGFDSAADDWADNPEKLGGIELGTGVFAVGFFPVDWMADTHDGEPRYGLQDEESRLNINKAPVEVLVRLFEWTCGLPTLECEALAGAVVDWRDENDDPEESGAESVSYHEMSDPYSPRNALFQMPEELLLVKGVTAEIFRRVEPYITVYGTGAVNVNTAPDLVLTCLGLGEPAITAVNSWRAGPDGIVGTGDDVPFERTGAILVDLDDTGMLSENAKSELRRAINGRLLTVRSDNFRGHVFRRLDNSAARMHIMFVFNRGGAVRLWRE